tara:strand:- start:9171 stop:11516 length:2346 start_codon:yes stop_codon:yes gene_type:complete
MQPHSGDDSSDDERLQRLESIAEQSAEPVPHGPLKNDAPAEMRSIVSRRKRMLEDTARSMGMSDEEALRMTRLIDQMLPDPTRMSTAENVGKRLDHAMEEIRAQHPKLVFTRADRRSPLDVSKVRKNFSENSEFAAMLDTEEDLLKALVVNDRIAAGHRVRAVEHQEVRALILEEMVRRMTMHEQWRHLLPKFMLPVFAMFHAADVKAKDLQIGSKLLNRIRDDIVEWSQGKKSREDLMTAARQTEEEFHQALKIDDPFETRKPVEETHDQCRERLRFALAEARSDLKKLDDLDADEDDVSAARMRVDRLVTAIDIDAGMDATGRLVFPSVDAFMDAIAARRRAQGGMGGEPGEGGVASGENAATAVESDSADESDDAPKVAGIADNVSPEREPAVDADVGDMVDAAIDPTGDVDARAEVLDGPSTEDYCPDIPDDLFGPEALAEDDDPVEKGPLAPSDDDHPFADAGTEVGSGGGPEDGASREEEGGEGLPPVGQGAPAFDPSDLPRWPSDNMAVRRIAPGLARSTGLSRSTFDKPFTMWRPSMEPAPFCFMGFRLHPDLAARQGLEGPIEPVDLSRLEIGDGQWKAATLTGPSHVLGQSHPLMLPPHSRLEWYGRTLGWNETDIRSLGSFGSPPKPETVIPKGDGRMLADAMRGVARLRLAELAQRVPGHFLADAKHGAERREQAAEDLARYWIFVLLARHDQAGFDLMLEDGFFQGVHGPDFVVDASGVADFGSAERGGHIGIFSPELQQKLPPTNSLKPYVGTMGDGVTSGIRRPGI